MVAKPFRVNTDCDFVISHITSCMALDFPQKTCQDIHGSTVICAVVSQQEGCGFAFRSRPLLSSLSLSRHCMYVGFSQGPSVSSCRLCLTFQGCPCSMWSGDWFSHSPLCVNRAGEWKEPPAAGPGGCGGGEGHHAGQPEQGWWKSWQTWRPGESGRRASIKGILHIDLHRTHGEEEEKVKSPGKTWVVLENDLFIHEFSYYSN